MKINASGQNKARRKVARPMGKGRKEGYGWHRQLCRYRKPTGEVPDGMKEGMKNKIIHPLLVMTNQEVKM